MKQALFLLAITAVVTACSSKVDLPKDPSNPQERAEYLQELKENRPDWTNKGLWEEDDFIYQVGKSILFDTEREAKKHAYRDASFRLSEYINQKINVGFRENYKSSGNSTDVTVQTVETEELANTASRTVVSTIAPHEVYVELQIDKNEVLGYTAFATVKVSQKSIKNAIKNAQTLVTTN